MPQRKIVVKMFAHCDNKMVYIPLMLLLLCPSYGQFPNGPSTANLPEQQQPKPTFNAHPSSHRRLQLTSFSGSSIIKSKEDSPARPLHESMRSKYYNYSQRVQQDRVLHPSHQLYSSWPSSIDMYRFKRDGTGSFDNIVKKLELVEYLTNGLVLTEALQSNKMKIGEITTDLLIVGQMPEDKDWIEILETNGVEKGTIAKIDELFNELKPLQDAIENGKSINIPNQHLDKIMNFLESFRSIDRLIQNTKFLEKVSTAYNDTLIRVSTYSSQIIVVLKFPLGMEEFKKIKDGAGILNRISKGAALLSEVQTTKTHDLLQTGYDACRKYQENTQKVDHNALQTCVENVVGAVSHLSLDDVLDDAKRNSFTSSSNIFNLIVAAMQKKKLQEIVNKKDEFDALRQTTSAITIFGNGMNKVEPSDKKGLENIISQLTPSTAVDLDALGSALIILKPIARFIEATKEILYLNSQNSTTKTPDIGILKRFKSYSGLPSGVDSLDLVGQNIGSTHALPPAVLMSGMLKRVENIKSFVAQLKPILQNSAGFKIIRALLEGVSEIKKLIASKPSDNLINAFSKIESIMKKFPNVENTSKLLNKLVQQLSLMKTNNVDEDLDALAAYFEPSDSDFFADLEKMFYQLSEFIKFASELRVDLKDIAVTTYNENVYKREFSKVEKTLEKIKSGLALTKKLDDAIRNKDIAKAKVDKLITKLNTSFGGNYNFASHQLTDSALSDDFIRTTVEEAVNVQVELDGVLKDKTDISKYAAGIKVFDKVQKIGSSTPDEVKSSKALLEELTRLKKIDIKIGESDAIAQLMPGSSFGSEILENLHHGVTAYSNIVDGAESMETLRRSIDALKPTNGALMGRVEKLLNGFEVVKITKDDSDLNVFNVIADATNIAENADKLKTWIEKVDQNERVAIERELMGVTKSRRLKRKVVSDAQTLQKVVSGLNTKSAQKIGKLSTGLRSLSSALTYANCDKTPSHVSCDKSTSNWIFYACFISGAVALSILISAVVWFIMKKKRTNGKKGLGKKEKKNIEGKESESVDTVSAEKQTEPKKK